jgi:hypothetical protein
LQRSDETVAACLRECRAETFRAHFISCGREQVTVTLCLQYAGAGPAHRLAKARPRRRRSEAWTVSSCRARYSIHSRGGRSAHVTDSVVADLLSCALFAVMGICVLLFGNQL